MPHTHTERLPHEPNIMDLVGYFYRESGRWPDLEAKMPTNPDTGIPSPTMSLLQRWYAGGVAVYPRPETMADFAEGVGITYGDVVDAFTRHFRQRADRGRAAWELRVGAAGAGDLDEDGIAALVAVTRAITGAACRQEAEDAST